METFISILLKIVSIVMLVIFGLSIILLVLTFRKPKKVSLVSISITILISLITLVIFASLTRYEPAAWIWLVMIVIGVAIGFFWARTTKVFTKGTQVMSQNSVLYLIVWGGIFALNQLITIATNKPPDITMALLIVSTATVWGTNGNIIRRYFNLKSDLQPAAAIAGQPAAGAVPATRPAPTTPAAKAAPPQKTQVAEPTSAGYCPKCGTASKEGAAFCMKCGGKL